MKRQDPPSAPREVYGLSRATCYFRAAGFHLRGGENGLFLIADVLPELGVRAFAPGTESGIFEADRTREAFARWKPYRDHVVQRR